MSSERLTTNSFFVGGSLAFHIPKTVKNFNYVIDLSKSHDPTLHQKRRHAKRSSSSTSKIFTVDLYSGTTYLGVAQFPYTLKDPNKQTVSFNLYQGSFGKTPKKVHMDCKDFSIEQSVFSDPKYNPYWDAYKAGQLNMIGESIEVEDKVDENGEEYSIQAFKRFIKRLEFCRDKHRGPFGNGDKIKRANI
ncbi:UNVERIFIED_CONTAM: hypothetical protein HDU68_005505, partial [Siphonaria sp. JEL0065]